MRIHFKDVASPDLKEGTDLTANCGALVPNAVFAMRFDFDLGDIVDWNRMMVCPDCLGIEPTNRFIYGLVTGQDWKDEFRAG